MSLAKLERYASKQRHEEVIKMGTELYKTKAGNNSRCLDLVLHAYKNTSYYKNKRYMIDQLMQLLSCTSSQSNIPSFCILQNEIAMCYVSCGEEETAIKHFKKIIPIKNDIPDVYNNLAVCYTNMKDYKKALVCLQVSVRLNPCDNVYLRLASIYFYTKQYEQSIEAHKNMQHPTLPNLYNSSFPYLAKKDFVTGFALYENRLAENNIHPQTGCVERLEIPSIKYWNGVDPCGHLMVIYEQGIGDNIQYFRFLIELASRFPEMSITYFCKSNVSNLFEVKGYSNIFIVNDSLPLNIQIFDKKVYIMSLPHLLHIDTISPCRLNYIQEDETNTLLWKDKLSSISANKLKVGLVYHGLLMSYIDKQIPLEEFEDICQTECFQVICLHKIDEKIETDIARVPFADKIHIEREMDEKRAFWDTIAILRNLDVLITIDTSIAHLAGVMGVKTLLLIGYCSDWRWFDTEEKVWYESVEIVRTNEQKPLEHLLPEVKQRLLAIYQGME